MTDRVRLEPQVAGNGNGGGQDPDSKLTVTMITPSPSVTGAEPGVGLRLSGELTEKFVTGITVQLVADGRHYPATTGMTGLTRTWSGIVRFYRAGSVQVHAEVSGTSTLGGTQLTAATVPVTVAVTLASAVPLYTVESPQPGPVGVGEAGETLPLRVRSSNQFGPRAVSWGCEANSGQAVQDQADTTLFTAAVPLTALPLGNRTISVQLQDPAGDVNPTTVTVQAIDVTPPHVQITWPPSGQAFRSGTQITVQGHAQDGQSGMTGGRVEWSLTGGAPFTTATSSNNWADWQAPVSIGDFGVFTITVRAVDAAGNVSTPQGLPVEMVSSYQPSDVADRLSSREYIAALLTVIRDTVRTAAGAAIASSDLEALLGQPFARLSQPLSAVGDTGDLLVNELRVPVEVLRRYTPPSGLLAARWTFSPDAIAGGGTAVRDISGNGNIATLSGAVVQAGQSGDGVSFDGAATYMQVPHSASLAFADADADFSVSFWMLLRSWSADGDWRSIAHKGSSDDQRTFAMWIEPTRRVLHARISTTADFNEGLNGTTPLPLGRWFHVAYVKQGGELRVYLDGNVDARTSLSADVVSNTGPVYFGKDPWFAGFDGMLDDIRIYRAALSDDSVQAIAAAPTEDTPQGQYTAALSGYLLTAYQALLTAAGTSYDEARLARTADPATRAALAARLGITLQPTRPDQLDQLTLDPAAITEALLESLFGLADTSEAKDVLRPSILPALLGWQLTTQALAFAQQDHSPPTPGRLTIPVLIDPDLIGPGDLVAPQPASPAGAILAARTSEVAGLAAALHTARTGAASPTAAMQAILAKALPGVDLAALAAEQAGGTDISVELATANLTTQAFASLLHMQALASTGPVTEAEWQDTENLLVQVQKRARLTDWRAAESAISLTPDHFKLGGPDPTPSRWRSLAQSRQDWLTVLGSRIAQRQELLDGYGTMLGDVESQVLPTLRDALVTRIAGSAILEDAQAWLTDRFQIDFVADGSQRITRLDQAAQTLQETVFSVRAGSLPQSHPAAGWTLVDEQSFDSQWNWLGTSDGWRSAMLAYFYPERLLMPTLRINQTPAFAALVANLAALSQLKPDDARAVAGQFLGSQLSQLYTFLPTQPTAVWSFDENSGTTAGDGTGHGNTGTLAGGAGWAGGVFSSGVAFDGVTGAIGITGQSGLSGLTNSFTVSFWARPTASHEIDTEATAGTLGTSGERYVWGPAQGTTTWGNSHAGLGISVGTNGVSVYEHAASYLPAVLVWVGPVTDWTHIAVVYDAGKPRLYVGGVLVRSRDTVSSQAHVHAMPTGIGGMGYGYFRGYLDQAAVYPAALTADQIKLLAFRLTDQRSDTDLASTATLSKTLLTVPPGTLSTTPPYLPDSVGWLVEIFYFVPLLLALRLQASGEYLAALGWFDSCYAFRLPPSRRKVYYGLQIEHNTPIDLIQPVGWSTRLNPHQVAASRPNPYTRYTLISLARCCTDFADTEFTRETPDSLAHARGLYLIARELLSSAELQPVPLPGAVEQALPDPQLAGLRLRVDIQLTKMRQGRNIAGLPRLVLPPAGSALAGGGSTQNTQVPVAAPPLRPAPYHYKLLIDRTKQLVALAQQVETAYLEALEKFDQASYRRFQASQGLELASATVQLQNLRVQEATDGMTLAQKQKAKADFVAVQYDNLILAGLNSYERDMLQSYSQLKTLRDINAVFDASIATGQAAAGAVAPWQWAIAGALSAQFTGRAILSGFINDAQAQLDSDTLCASHENRVADWKLQKSIAQQDSIVADQQIQVAQDQLATAGQEVKIAQLQADQAKAAVDFLDRQFTNQELYQWMSNVLAGVYRFFLQQATAMARMAQDQLGFERQEPSATFIQSDYWQPAQSSAATGATTDRRGLTGSERLLQDIYQLDQYAFQTEKRKLNLTQTFSLAQLAPLEFERFRQTGTLDFATPMALFDADFPGHYLRLIRQVRLSISALIPPARGLRAQLLNPGISRVIVGDDTFRQVTIRRNPEQIAFTSPVSATGIFELDAQSDLLYPFEAMGVDTTWELQLPKAANPFDYSTISDVQLTIDYTALSSFDYRVQVIDSLNSARTRSGDRAFALRRDFPDAWYQLFNPPAEASSRSVTITLDKTDVPSNLTAVTVSQVALYLVPASTVATPFPPVTAQVSHLGAGGSAQLTGGLASTRRGNAPQWLAIAGTDVTGDWQLTLPLDGGLGWDNGAIADALLVVGYSGRAPAWLT